MSIAQWSEVIFFYFKKNTFFDFKAIFYVWNKLKFLSFLQAENVEMNTLYSG